MAADSPLFLRSLLKERFLITLGLIVGLLLLALYYVFFYVPLYESSAKLYVRNIRKENVIGKYGGGSTVTSESGYSNPLFNYLQILGSQKLAERVYDPLSTDYENELDRFSVYSLPKWYRLYPKLIHAKVVPSTDIIKVTFKWSDANSASEAFGTVINEFKRLNLNILNQTGGSHREYLEGELKRIDNDLTTTRNKIQAFQVSSHSVDLKNELDALTKMRVGLDKEAHLLRGRLEYSRQRFNSLAQQLNLPDGEAALKATGIGTDPYLVRLRADLANLQQKYAKGLTKMTPKHPDIIALKNELNLMERQIADRQALIVGDAAKSNQFPGIYDEASASLVSDFSRAEADLISQTAQLKSLTNSIITVRLQEQDIPKKQGMLQQLSKREKSLATAYDDVLNSLMEANLKEKQVADNIEILSAPSKAKRVWIPLFIKGIAFIMMGLLFGFALAWSKREVQDNWSNADEMSEQTQWPVLGIVPWFNKKNDNPQDAKASKSFRDMSFAQMTDSLVNRTYSQGGAQWLSFVSPTSHRSANPTISNVAAQLVKRGKKVLVIELEPHIDYKKSLMIWREGQLDFTDMVNHLNESIVKDKSITSANVSEQILKSFWEVSHPALSQTEGRFYYLPKSVQRVFVDDLIASPGFELFIHAVKKEVDFILMDLPSKPWILPDMSHVLKKSDGVIVVTPLSGHRRALMTGVQQLKRLGARVMGIIAREKIDSIDKYMKSA